MNAALAALTLLAAADPVTLADEGGAFALDNGIVAAKVSKRNGDLVSLKYKGHEFLVGGSGHAYAYWSHGPTGGSAVTAVTIDPKANGGARAEVSVKAVAEGRPVGSGPGGSVVADVEIRYCLGRGESGVYTYSVFEHKPD